MINQKKTSAAQVRQVKELMTSGRGKIKEQVGEGKGVRKGEKVRGDSRQVRLVKKNKG